MSSTVELQLFSSITFSPNRIRVSHSPAMGDYTNAVVATAAAGAVAGDTGSPPRVSPVRDKVVDERMSIAFLAPEPQEYIRRSSMIQLPRIYAPTSSFATCATRLNSSAVLPPLRGLVIPGLPSADAPVNGTQRPRIKAEAFENNDRLSIVHSSNLLSHDARLHDQKYAELSPSNSPESTGDCFDANGAFRRAPRAPRPSYSEEQKFFIMFLRIVRELPWPDIEAQFEQHFGRRTGARTKGGLTSVYYRIRRSWDLEQVLETNEEAKTKDKEAVFLRANNFSPAFLTSIGYFACHQARPSCSGQHDGQRGFRRSGIPAEVWQAYCTTDNDRNPRSEGSRAAGIGIQEA